MPDGTTKQKLKAPINADPGVHSSFNLDQIAQNQIPNVATLPTITEAKAQDATGNGNPTSDLSPPSYDETRNRSRNSESDATVDNLTVDNIPRNLSQPVFSSNGSGRYFQLII